MVPAKPGISLCHARWPFTDFFHSNHYAMQYNINKSQQPYFIIALVLLMPIIFGFTTPAAPQTTCPEPQVSVIVQSSSAASFSWGAVSGATEYVVFYVRKGDNYTSQQIHTQSTSIAITGLTPGKYNFYFATVCAGGISAFIIIEDLVI